MYSILNSNNAVQVRQIGARQHNDRTRLHNCRLSYAGNGALITPLQKEIAGHPPLLAAVDPALAALPVPVPVGAPLPILGFFPAIGITHAQITQLKNNQINDLSWFYNVPFGGPFSFLFFLFIFCVFSLSAAFLFPVCFLICSSISGVNIDQRREAVYIYLVQ